MEEKLKQTLRAVLGHFPEVQLCMVFGSAASAKMSAKSDLDVAVAAARPLSSEMRLKLIEALSTAVNREIDLVDLRAVSGPIMRQALSKGTVVQNRDKTLYASLISRMLLDQADVMPYYERTLRERRERFFHG
jgi:uncharacterized protein